MIGDGSRTIHVRFWGVRGSIPSPLHPSVITDKVSVGHCLRLNGNDVPFQCGSTYGGNTTCVEVRCEGVPFILDMGTGLRLLGKKLLPSVRAKHGLTAVVLQSHLHHDHIMGFPFFAPIFLKKREAEIRLTLVGGSGGGLRTSEALRGYMRHPFFPVDLESLERAALRLEDWTVCDGFEHEFLGTHSPIQVLARRVHHPDETYGYRITYRGRSVAFTTDHEPVGGGGIPNGLLELVQGADLWITDCQYSHAQYLGEFDGYDRFNWGHSYPEYLAEVAKRAGPKRILTMHHDPDADDLRISRLAQDLRRLSDTSCDAAHEGLEVALECG